MPKVRVAGHVVNVQADPGTPEFESAVNEIGSTLSGTLSGTMKGPQGASGPVTPAPPQGTLAHEAFLRKSRIQTEQSMAGVPDMMKQEVSKPLGIIATSLPIALAAPLAGAMGLAGGMAVMGGAGLTTGGIRETLSAALGNEPKSGKQLAKDLSLDTAIGMASEFIPRGVGLAAAKIGGPLWEGLLLKAAQKSSDGRRVLSDMETTAHTAVQEMVKGKPVDFTNAYRKFIQTLASIPEGSGSAGKRLAGPVGGDVGDLAASVSKDLGAVDATGIPTVANQDMAAAIRMHRSANRIAYGLGENMEKLPNNVPAEGLKAARTLADDMRGILVNNMTPAERQAFEAAKDITKERINFSVGTTVAKMVTRRLMTGAVGAAVGGEMGGWKGAAVGAGVGLGLDAVEQKLAPMVLENLVTNNKALFQRAVGSSTSPGALDGIVGMLARNVPNAIKERIRAHVAEEKSSVVK